MLSRMLQFLSIEKNVVESVGEEDLNQKKGKGTGSI